MLLSTFEMKTLQSGTFNPACKNQITTGFLFCTPRLSKTSIPNQSFPFFKGLVPGLNSPVPALGVAPAWHFCPDFVPVLLPVLLNCSHQHLCAPDRAGAEILTTINPNLRRQQLHLFPAQISGLNCSGGSKPR